MKSFLLLVGVLFLGNSALAHDVVCEGEAQIIATVIETKTDSMTYCKAVISVEAVQYFQSSLICPMSLSTVISEGIYFPLLNGHDCEIHRGEEISGVITLQAGKTSMYYSK